VKEYGKGLPENMKSQEIDLASQIAKALTKPFHPEQFHDEYQAKVQQLVDSKKKGEAPPQQDKTKRLAPVVDLMAALRKSIEGKRPSGRRRSCVNAPRPSSSKPPARASLAFSNPTYPAIALRQNLDSVTSNRARTARSH
jgi:DNA end-binding protein Ku